MGRRHGVAGSPIDGATASVERVRYPEVIRGAVDEWYSWLPGCKVKSNYIGAPSRSDNSSNGVSQL